MADWESAERVQKNDAGEYRALIGGEWVPVAKAQRNEAGTFRVSRIASEQPAVRLDSVEPPNWLEKQIAKLPNIVNPKEESQLRGLAMGAADPSVGLFQIGANVLGAGEPVNSAIAAKEAEYQAGRKGAGREGFDAMRTAGNVASPTTLLPMTRLAKVAPTVGTAEKIRQGAGVGGATAMSMPVVDGGADFGDEKLLQAAGGMGIGTVLPASWAAGKGVGRAIRDTADLVLPGGAERISNRYMNKILGRDAITDAVMASRAASEPFVGPSQPGMARSTMGELVSGNLPTTAETVAHLPAASPLLAHQKIVAQTPGGISGQFGERALSQQAANKAAIAPIAQTPEALEAAIAKRSGEALNNYAAAYEKVIKADPALAEMSKNPYFQKALPDAIDLAKANGVDPKVNLTQFLHYVKIGMDKQLGRTGDTALASTEKEAVQNVRKNLIEWMGKKNPAYETARSEFQAASQPINQMQVGQAIERKMVNPSGKETPGTFLNAISDETKLVKSITGQQRPVFTPAQQKVIDAIAQTQERKLASMNPVQRTDLQGGVNVAEETRTHLPNLLSRPAMIANWMMKLAAGKGSGIETKVDQIMAQRYLDPKAFADAMEMVPQTQRERIVRTIMERGGMPAIGATSQTVMRQEGAQ